MHATHGDEERVADSTRWLRCPDEQASDWREMGGAGLPGTGIAEAEEWSEDQKDLFFSNLRQLCKPVDISLTFRSNALAHLSLVRARGEGENSWAFYRQRHHR